jgi:hypothetical protein
LVLVWLFLQLPAASAAPTWQLAGSARGIVLPVYAHDKPDAVATIRIDEARSSPARRFFFRIGLIPELSLSGLNLTIRDPSALQQVLRELLSFARPDADARSVAIKGFSIEVSGEPSLSVSAASAQLTPQGDLVLKDVLFEEDETRIYARSGTLLATGLDSGTLRLDDGGLPRSKNLGKRLGPL